MPWKTHYKYKHLQDSGKLKEAKLAEKQNFKKCLKATYRLKSKLIALCKLIVYLLDAPSPVMDRASSSYDKSKT